MGARVDPLWLQSGRMSGIVLDRNLEGDSVECNCMDTDVVKLVLFFSMIPCICVLLFSEI